MEQAISQRRQPLHFLGSIFNRMFIALQALNISHETMPKWQGLLMIKLAAYQANGGRMKLRLAATANRLNVEHRTSNIERRILMALRFFDLTGRFLGRRRG